MAKIPVYIDVECPRCGGGDITKAGKRNDWHRYECGTCGKWFRNRVRVEDAAEGRKYGDEAVGAALYQYFMGGMSIRNVARNIAFPRGRFRRHPADTIFQWAKDYVEAATYALRDIKAQTGDEWVADEMVVKVDGRNMYHWNIMDKDTRYLAGFSHIREQRRGRSHQGGAKSPG